MNANIDTESIQMDLGFVLCRCFFSCHLDVHVVDWSSRVFSSEKGAFFRSVQARRCTHV